MLLSITREISIKTFLDRIRCNCLAIERAIAPYNSPKFLTIFFFYFFYLYFFTFFFFIFYTHFFILSERLFARLSPYVFFFFLTSAHLWDMNSIFRLMNNKFFIIFFIIFYFQFSAK